MNNQYILEFLRDLMVNNNRPWFNEHKDRYLESLHYYQELVAHLIAACSEFDSSIAHLTPADCIYRIYRDTRFSADKTPYKQHFGAYIAPQGGRKSTKCGYFFCLEPEQSLILGGVYMPSTTMLNQLREYLQENQEEFLSIIHEPEFVRTFGELKTTKMLKKTPKGFESDSPIIDYLKMKDNYVQHDFTDAQVLQPDFFQQAVQVCQVMYPFNEFMNRGMEE